ncbi:hypothetical protein CANINC_003215 [Pichia inconspicua]|uniref:Uncharacterized protein n=1 Tax=Pichia inconspicua TaxID=52247 RepID=A0A4T0X0S5_9ASCO|nr:hypothetical protein CANINC_003215 [[Candida] inconspicua]
MKRVYSDSSDDHTSITSKLRKLKSKLFSVIGKSDENEIHIEKAPLLNDNELGEKRESTPINASFLNTSQGPITARQLQEYYKSLQLENSMLAESLNNTNDKPVKELSGEWKNAESTNIDIDDNQNDNDINDIIVLNDEDKDDSNDSNNEIELPESLETLPYFHQPDPLERANLIQLKRMMELEKYRRYRLNYLKEHTRHLGKKNAEPKKQNKITKDYRSRKPADVPSDRKNISGIFNLSMIEDVPDTDKVEEIKPIDNNLVKKLKFADTKSKVANFDMANKPRSFKPEPVVEKIVTPVESSKSETSFPKQDPKADVSNISVEDKPSVGFSFGAKKSDNAQLTKPSLETVVDADLLNAQSTEVKKPIFSTPSAPSTAISSSTEKGSNTASLFGQNKPSANLFTSKDDTSSADGAGSSLFGQTKTDSKEKPLFSFNEPVAKDSVPKFNFAKPTNLQEGVDKKKQSSTFQVPTETGAKRTHDDQSEDISSKKFSFGAPAKSDELSILKANPPNNDTKTTKSIGAEAFSFNTPSTSKPAEIPKFSFDKAPTSNTTLESKTESKENDNKPKFSFGTFKPDDKSGAFSFGKPATKIDGEPQKPAFSLNSKPAENSTESKNPPKFNFGTNASVSFETFKSGNSTVSDSVKADTGSKFNFALNNASKDNTGNKQSNESAKPAFSFGGSNGTQFPGLGSTASSVTTPGASVSPAPAQNATPAGGFSFATSNKSSTPQFNLGTTNSKTNAPQFNFGMTDTSNKRSLNEEASTGAKQDTTKVGNIFSFNSNAFPSLEEAKQKALTINQQSSTPFKFGDNAATPNAPLSNGFGGGFGNSTTQPNSSNNNNTNFGLKANNNASGFGGSNTQVGFGNNMNNNTGFGGNSTGFGSSGTGFAGSSAGFGGTTTAFGGSTTAFGGSTTAFGGNNAGFGGNNTGINSNVVTNTNVNPNPGMNANTGFNVNANNSGFSFGGSGPSSGVNSRASTPNFNFTGSQGQNVDPSAIFGANGNNDVQNTGPGRRRIAYPRRRR